MTRLTTSPRPRSRVDSTWVARIYRDSDGSYSKSETEQRFKDVTVALVGEDGTPVLDADGKPMTAITDENGAYRFAGLAPGAYRVVIVDPNAGDLAGLIPTQAYTGRGATQATCHYHGCVGAGRGLRSGCSRHALGIAYGMTPTATAWTRVSPACLMRP